MVTNDLLYIPTSADRADLSERHGGTYDDFIAFISGDECLADYIGQIIPRNACRAPWTNTLDGRVAVQLPFKRVQGGDHAGHAEPDQPVRLREGPLRVQSFGQLTSVSRRSRRRATRRSPPTAPLVGYNIASIMAPTFRKFLRDDLRSRWQMQLGARVRF